MAVNKVVYNRDGIEETLIDLTSDTVTADKLAKGYTAHTQAGELITGTMESGGSGGEDFASFISGTLTDWVVPNVETIRPYCCYGLNSDLDWLQSITLPEGLKTIGDYAFGGCRKITSINLPSTLQSIGKGAFRDWSKLLSITIPSNVTQILSSTFSSCASLTSVEFLGNVTTIGDYAFYMCSSLSSITLPEGLTTIGREAFEECNLQTITIPASVTTLGYYCFQYNRKLTTVTFKGTPTKIYSAFYTDTAITDIYVPWAEGAVSGAPWGATNATVHYNTTT